MPHEVAGFARDDMAGRVTKAKPGFTHGGFNVLVLSRKKREQIVVGQNVIITVVEIRGDKVRIGIDAPDNVMVDRREVREAKQKQKEGEA